jgi:hypothetical protein
MLSLLGGNKMDTLLEHLHLTKTVPGHIFEFGVYQGGTLMQMANAAKGWEKRLFGVDTFQGLPYSSRGSEEMFEGRFDGVDYYSLLKAFNEYNVTLVKGEFPATISKIDMLLEKVHCISFAHLDFDLGMPTLAALLYLDTKLPLGGTIVVDDYEWRETPGIKRAIQYFVKLKKNFYHVTPIPEQYQFVLKRAQP